MPIQDLKKIIPAFFENVWYLKPEFLWSLKKDLAEKPHPEATTSLRVYKQFYR